MILSLNKFNGQLLEGRKFFSKRVYSKSINHYKIKETIKLILTLNTITMKKNLLSIALTCLITSAAVSQTVPNGSFENWTTTTYDVVQFYADQSANGRALQDIGQTVLSKVTDPYQGTYAVKLETKALGTTTVAGYFVDGSPSGSSAKGGIPYSQQPTGLTGHFKCNIPAGDSAIVLVFFKKNGLTMPGGMYIKKFWGVQSTYASFTMPISLSSPPDTIIIGAVSSDITISGFDGIPGSTFQLDSITFKGVVSQPVNMNGSFELWTTGALNTPNGWKVKGDSTNKGTPAYTGSYALKLEVVNYGSYVEGDQVTTGTWANPMNYGGQPYTLMNDSLIGYYKLVTTSNDTGYINLQGTKNFTMNVGMYGMPFTSTAVYKRFSMPINFSGVPDTLRVDIGAAKWPTNPAWAGSKLYVDGLQLKSQPLSVPVIFTGENYIGAYPNPSNGQFNLVYDSDLNEPVSLQVFNETGQLVLSQQLINRAKNKIDISSFGQGLYILKTEQQGRISTRRVLVQ